MVRKELVEMAQERVNQRDFSRKRSEFFVLQRGERVVDYKECSTRWRGASGRFPGEEKSAIPYVSGKPHDLELSRLREAKEYLAWTRLAFQTFL